MIKKSESLKKNGGRAGKQRQLGEMEWIPLRKLRIDLANGKMIVLAWREARRLEKN